MADFPFGAAASGVGSGLQFVGGLIQNAESGAQAGYNRAMQQAQYEQSMNFAKTQFDWQKDLALNSTLYRVQDAIRAGISPVIALGMQPFNPSPISVGGTIGGSLPNFANPAAGLADSFGRAGQSIEESLGKNMTQYQRAMIEAENRRQLGADALQSAQIRELDSRSAYFNAQAARVAGVPAFPTVYSDTGTLVPGQGDSHSLKFNQVGVPMAGLTGGSVNKVPEVPTHVPGAPGIQSGRPAPSLQAQVNPDGGIYFTDAPGTTAASGNIMEGMLNFTRNRLGPMVGDYHDPHMVMREIARVYPEATGYRVGAFGSYYPTYGSNYSERAARIERGQQYWDNATMVHGSQYQRSNR